MMKLIVDPYNVAFYFWSFPKKMKTYANMKTCMLMFIADLFTIVKNGGRGTDIQKENGKNL